MAVSSSSCSRGEVSASDNRARPGAGGVAAGPVRVGGCPGHPSTAGAHVAGGAPGGERHCCIELSHAILTVGSPVNRCADPFEGLRQGACDLSEGRHQGLEGTRTGRSFVKITGDRSMQQCHQQPRGYRELHRSLSLFTDA
jgi:hypothetical protein